MKRSSSSLYDTDSTPPKRPSMSKIGRQNSTINDTKTTTVRDPIHNEIILTEFDKKIVDTPQFQRLRRLKQLGATSFVYPSANHTRFEHSLGVGHLAWKYAEHFRKEQPELDITKRRVCGL